MASQKDLDLMSVPTVQVSETLWRSVRPNEVKSDTDGKLVLSSNAFNDRSKKPSVDREALRNCPTESKKSESDGIVALKVIELRSMSVPNKSPNALKADATYKVDAKADPLEDNISHALIVCDPEIGIKEDKLFRRLKDSLARLAEKNGWVIPPSN